MATFAQEMIFGPYFSGGTLQQVDVYHYVVGTSTLKDVYSDREKSFTAAQPVQSDAEGIASFFADGLYKFIIKIAGTNTVLYTYDNFNVADQGLTGKGNALASASTLVLGTDGDYFHVTGTNTISTISGSIARVTLSFDAILTLGNSGVLILQDGQSVTTQAGDVYVFQNEGGGIWREVSRSNIRTAIRNMPSQLENIGLLVSVASNAITVALKNVALQDPTAQSPVKVAFRNASLTVSDYSVVSIASALSLSISTGSTLGFSASQTGRIYIGLLNYNGAAELFVYAPWNGTSNSLIGLHEHLLASTSAEGGAGGADNAQVLYSMNARSNVPIRLIGYFDIQTGATPGNWGTAATQVQLLYAGVPRTGAIIQSLRTVTGAVATGTTTIPNDDTIPQISEGNEFMTQTITPTSAVNLLRIAHRGYYAINNSDGSIQTALFQDSTANALGTMIAGRNGASSSRTTAVIEHQMVSGTISATTFRLRAGTVSGGTVTFNGVGGSRDFGGAIVSTLSVEEIMV